MNLTYRETLNAIQKFHLLMANIAIKLFLPFFPVELNLYVKSNVAEKMLEITEIRSKSRYKPITFPNTVDN